MQLCDTSEEQRQPGGTEVKNGQKQPGRLTRMKQVFGDIQAVLGTGFVIAVAYLDPGSLQADINVGSQAAYRLIWTVLWSTVLSLYIQMLCVRLAVYKQKSLADAVRDSFSKPIMLISWFLAEISVLLTDLPAVIGVAIAFNTLFGLPYFVGVLMSFVSTIFCLSAQKISERAIEVISALFIFLLAIVLFISWGFVDTKVPEFFKGTLWGFVETKASDAFDIIAMVGAVVMPHNLYLHTGCLQKKYSKFASEELRSVVKQNNLEMIAPIIFSFFVNTAVIVIAAELAFGSSAGLTDFSHYLSSNANLSSLVQGLWGMALFSSSQSSCTTATYTGEMVMVGHLNWKVPFWVRSIIVRSLTIIPCGVVAYIYEDHDLDHLINCVNSMVALLLPCALTVLVKFVSSAEYMGKLGAPSLCHSYFMKSLAFVMLLINAVLLILPGGGFFGDLDLIRNSATFWQRAIFVVIAVLTEIFYIGWNILLAYTPIKKLSAFPIPM